VSRRQKPPVGDELHRLLSDLDHHNVKGLAELGEAALGLVYSVLNHTIRKEKPETRSDQRISTVEELLSQC
jgi:hypothetical protein